MADYQRIPRRFFYRGISLLPEDALPEGKAPYAQNVRSYQEGTITTRWGTTRQTASAFAAAVHSLFRLTDTSLFGAGIARRFVGEGTRLWSGPTSLGAYTQFLNLAFSGNPLSAVAAAPVNSPRPYLYVADSLTQRKINGDLNDYPIGLVQPTPPPTARLGAVETTFLETITTGAWNGYAGGTAPTVVSRINTVVTQLLYDSGTTGMASVALTNMANIVPGTTVEIGASPVTVIVQEVHPPVTSTTIARILYDVGSTGLCTIQPTGSFNIGQIEAALPDEIRRRYEDLNLPVPPRVTVSRTVDFPVDSLVLLSGTEVVRILSVALGPDGVQSFRCSTVGTHSASGTIDGIASFRAYFPTTRSAGDPATGDARQNTLTAGSPTVPAVGGIQTPISGGERNWGLVGTRATQPDDIIRFGIRASLFAYLTSVRLMLNITDDDGSGGADFLHNYYFYEWRANDLLTAVQASAGAATGLMADAQAEAVAQGQVDGLYDTQFGQEPSRDRRGVAPLDSPSRRLRYDEEGQKVWPGPRGRLRTDSFVTAGATPSRQLVLGNNQWIMLQCRVRDLTRVGTDATKTLSNINAAAIVVQTLGTVSPITFQYSDGYLTGGYGPDVGATLPPYVYRYRYRSTITGERSNPSPSMRAGVHPHRGRVILQAGAASTAPQTDTIDWFRFGGALVRWQYVGSQANAVADFNDDKADTEVDGGETLRTDLYQPWPSYDLPRSGTAILAGTAVQRVSGDTFNTGWAADSVIIVNGVATTLYRQPASTTRLEIIDNAGEGAAVNWSMPAPTLLAQPLPAMWGGPVNAVWFHFACGDPADPGLLHWTYGNDPDATSPANTIVASSASEPLQNGCFFDGQPYVFTTERLLRIVATFGDITTFRCVETPCTKGLWGRWFFAVAPEGIYFGNKSGIYLTAGGGEAISITEEDLKPLFPQDGGVGQSIRGMSPPDFTVPTRLKLSYVDSVLYFDYQDTVGALRTLAFEPGYKRWTPDIYGSGVTARLAEPGPQVHTNLIGCVNGHVYQANPATQTDDGVAMAWEVRTPWENGEEPRAHKHWGDAVVAGVPGAGYTITPVSENGATIHTATVVSAGATRVTTIVEINSGSGVLARNIGLQITGTTTGETQPRPLLFFWEPATILKQVSIARRATDWEDLGYKGAKFIQGIVIRANTFGVQKSVRLEYEGGHLGVALTLQHQGEVTYAYPIQPAGWTPFIAELVRLLGNDTNPWLLLDWRWIWEPAPEAATQWQTQETTFDLPGFLEVRDALIAYQAHCPVTFTVWHEGTAASYTLPSTGDVYSQIYQPIAAAKGRWCRFRFTADSPFRLFAKDTRVRVQGWGQPGGYRILQPFGGPHRETGAQI